QVGQFVGRAELFVEAYRAYRAGDVHFSRNHVGPERLRRAMVFGRAGERCDVGERDIEEHGSHAVTDGIGLSNDGQMVLRVGAVGGIFTAAGIIVAASLVEEEFGELPVARVAGRAVEGNESDLLALMFRDIDSLARTVC